MNKARAELDLVGAVQAVLAAYNLPLRRDRRLFGAMNKLQTSLDRYLAVTAELGAGREAPSPQGGTDE